MCLFAFAQLGHSAEATPVEAGAEAKRTPEAACTTPWKTKVASGQVATGFCPDPPYPAGLIVPPEFFPGGRGCRVTKLCKDGRWVIP